MQNDLFIDTLYVFFSENNQRIFDILASTAQCGNFRIFLSLRFYVKSVLENGEVSKSPFGSFLGSEVC